MKSRKELIDYLNRLVSGEAHLSDLAAPIYEVWRQDLDENEIYYNKVSGERLPLQELRELKANQPGHLILVSYGRNENQENYENEGRENTIS